MMNETGLLRFNRTKPTMPFVRRLCRQLIAGRVAVFPTETQYALGADVTSDRGVGRVREIKGRSKNQPLSIFLPDRQSLADWEITLPDWAESLAEAFWPGPLTLILPTRNRLFHRLGGADRTVGVRVSPEPIVHRLCHRLGHPLIATSANPSGLVLSSTAENHWLVKQAAQGFLLWARPARFRRRPASTVLDCTGRRVCMVRDGAIPSRIWRQAVPASRLDRVMIHDELSVPR